MWVADCFHSSWTGRRVFPYGQIPLGCEILAVRFIPAWKI